MGTRREVKGYAVVFKPYRKCGNGAVGGGRKGRSGKQCFLYRIAKDGERQLIASAEGPNAKAAAKSLRESTDVIPTYVALNYKGETSF